MKPRHLTDYTTVCKSEVKTFDDVFNVALFFHEAEATIESDRTNHIECVPLKPRPQINYLPSRCLHRISEDVAARVNKRLKTPNRSHGKLLRDRSLQRLVVLGVSCREH